MFNQFVGNLVSGFLLDAGMDAHVLFGILAGLAGFSLLLLCLVRCVVPLHPPIDGRSRVSSVLTNWGPCALQGDAGARGVCGGANG